MLVNPGVSSVGVSRELGESEVDVYRLFEELVLSKQEEALKGEARELLGVLRDDLLLLDEYEKRVKDLVFEGQGVVVPSRPSVIDGDRVECKKKGKSEVCELVSVVDVEGAFRVDWQSSSLTGSGFRAGGVSGDFSSRVYKEEVNRIYAQSKDGKFKDGSKWVFDDGSPIVDSVGGRDVSVVTDSVGAVDEARMEYFKDKRAYQRDLMYRFVQLSITDATVKENVRARWGKDVVVMVGVD